MNPGSPAWGAGVLVQARRPPQYSMFLWIRDGVFRFTYDVLLLVMIRGSLEPEKGCDDSRKI